MEKRLIDMKTFLENLLGNPKKDTFLYWITDGGFLAILIIVFSIILWLLLKAFIKSKLNQRLTILTKQEIDKTIDIYTSGLKSIEGKYFNVLSALFISLIALTLIYSVLGNNIDPLVNILNKIGANVLSWLLIDGIRILTIIVLSFFCVKFSKNIIPKLLTSIMLGQSSTSDHDEILKRSKTLSGVPVTRCVGEYSKTKSGFSNSIFFNSLNNLSYSPSDMIGLFNT